MSHFLVKKLSVKLFNPWASWHPVRYRRIAQRQSFRLLIAAIMAASVAPHLIAQSSDPSAPPAPAFTNTAPVAAKPPAPPPRGPEAASTPASVVGTSGHNKLLKLAADKNRQLIFLGDSITAYWLRAGLPVWTKYYAPYDAGDFGIPGETTDQTLGHITGGILDGLHPKAVVILIGTNNVGKLHDQPEWVAAGIQKVVTSVREKLPQSQIILMGVFPCGHQNDARRAKIEIINGIISKTDFGPQVHYLDIGAKFLDPSGDLPKELFPDLLHPSAQGYQIWAENMQPTLDPLLK
jgi:lysophospholipase L1-like esterase